jgi:flagellar biosynthetic protein FlhB
MADDDKDSKTEDPTGKRLGEAHDRGQVAVSRDISTVVMLAAGTVVVLSIIPWSMRPVLTLMRRYMEDADQFDIGNQATFYAVMYELAQALALCFAPIFGVLIAAAIAAHVFQVGWVWATEKLTIKWDFFVNLVNPTAGLKRLFTPSALIEFGKGVIKVAIVSTIGYVVLKPEVDQIELLVGMQPMAMMAVLQNQTMHLLFPVMATLGLIGLVDIFYQRWQLNRNLRMSKQEVKDEHKNAEGDPHIKGHMRKIRLTRARKRMLAAVPKAAVVVTNPTHYAIALHYEMGEAGAPRVVAKGVDFLARKIREIAEENDVPIVENPPLARALYATVDLDEEIPPDHYKAVAEVIGFVMRLKRRPSLPKAS